MLIIKRLIGIILLLTGILITQGNAQPLNLVLQDMTITTTETFTAINSITAGPNFTIANSGDVTFISGNFITLNSGFSVILGGLFQAFPGATLGIKTETPMDFTVLQNYPNPFNTTTEIRYGLPNCEHVTIVVYNLFGQKIRTLLAQNQHAGYHTVAWDGRNETGQKVSSGIFFYKIETDKYSTIRKMMLMK
jgi:hypothetical protein